MWCCDIEWNVVVGVGQCFQVGVDFVGDVVVGGDVVGVDDYCIDFVFVYQDVGCVVGNQVVWYVVLGEFLGGE